MAVYEVCIAARDLGPGRAREGDIIAVREPLGFVNRKELHDYVWVVMELEASIEELTALHWGPGEAVQGKRRFNIDLASLDGAFDTDRARNPEVPYQPFIDLDASGRLQPKGSPRRGVRLRDARDRRG